MELKYRTSGGEKYETPEWILQGYEWETLEMMDTVLDEFNSEFGADFEFPLRPKGNPTVSGFACIWQAHVYQQFTHDKTL